MARTRKLLVAGGKWPLETFIARRLQGLAQRGYSVKVASNENGKPRSSQTLAGVEWMPLPVWSGSKARVAFDLAVLLLKGFIRSPRRAWQILRMPPRPKMDRLSTMHMFLPFVGEHPDLLHFEWNTAAVWYMPLADLFGCPMIVSCRGSQVNIAPHNPDRNTETSLIPLTFQRARAIHCVSRAIQKEVEAMGADPAKIHVITPAVDPDVFQPAPAGPAGSGFRIAMTGSVIWSKGYDYALEALRLLRQRGIDASITIMGGMDKGNRQRLLFAIDDLDLKGFVHVKGSLAPAAVIDELRQSSVLLLASLSEGISNAVLEAMSCGLPVVTTACPGMEEAVTDSVEGFLVPLRDPAAMAGALERLARDPELRRQMGKAGRERILRDFPLSQQIDKWTKLYEGVAK